MKKSYILGLAALAVIGLASCQDDQDPKIGTATEFVLNTPPMAEQSLELTPEGTYTFTVSQPNYGLTLAPTYGLQVSLKEDFTSLSDGTYVNPDGEEVQIPAYVTIPLESQLKAVLEVKQSNLAAAMCALRGIGDEKDYTDEGERPLYVRATAIVASQESTAMTSNVITLKYVKGYCALNPSEITDVLWTPGGANGWDFGKAMRIPGKGDGVYEGYMAVDGDFKFTSVNGWTTPGNYGAGKDANMVQKEDGSWEGTLVENGGNFNGLPAGLYYVKVTITNPNTQNDDEAGTAVLVPITKVGIIGDFNGWGGDVEMTPEPGYGVWKAENVDLGGGGWKFRMNGEWTYNLGGDALNNLTQDGNNISEGGTHTVILDLTTLPYSARLE